MVAIKEERWPPRHENGVSVGGELHVGVLRGLLMAKTLLNNGDQRQDGQSISEGKGPALSEKKLRREITASWQETMVGP